MPEILKKPNTLNKPMTRHKNKSTGEFMIEIIEVMLIFFVLSWLMKSYVFYFDQVSEKGMNPTLSMNSRLLVAKLGYTDTKKVKRGDVIVYQALDQQKVHVKRVIGMPGDRVTIRNGYTYINGQPVYERYTTNPLTYQFSEVTVPKDHVFVLNDNRYEDNDSRTFGSIPAENLRGKVIMCYWPLTKIRFL